VKIAITGGFGYIGSAIASALINLGYEVIRFSPSKVGAEKRINGMTDFCGSISDEEMWCEILQFTDKVIHLASITSLVKARDNPQKSLEFSIKPLNAIEKASKRLDICPQIVFASTATVYGMVESLPVNEKAKTAPITIYDKHKIIVENRLIALSEQGRISYTTLRLSNVYGLSNSDVFTSDRGVLNHVIRNVARKKPIIMYGNGLYTRDYVHISDVVSAFTLALNNRLANNKIYNVGSGKGICLIDLFGLIKKIVYDELNIKVEILGDKWPENEFEINKRNFTADISKIKNELSWTPKIQINQGIKELVNYYGKHSF